MLVNLDIDECYTSPCKDETETCINTNGGFFCEDRRINVDSIPQPAFLIEKRQKKPYYFSGGKLQKITLIPPLANQLVRQDRFMENVNHANI